jgi:hypothetical protein
MWRELARPVTFFDLCSPGDFLLVGRNRRIRLSFQQLAVLPTRPNGILRETLAK